MGMFKNRLTGLRTEQIYEDFEEYPVKVFHWKKLHPGNDFPLNVIIVQDDLAQAPLHTHDFEELLLIVKGTAIYTSPSGEYQLEPGDIFLMHPGQLHGFSNSNHLVVYNILWNSSELKFDFNTINHMPGYHIFFQLEPNSREKNHFKQHFRLNHEQLFQAKTLIEQMHDELTKRKEGYQHAVYSLLSLLFIMICRQTVELNEESVCSIQNIAEVIQYMEKNYSKPLDRDYLAHIANMSSATFFRHFRQATGLSPMNYLQKLRLNHAELLLRTTVLSLSEISTQCGFCDSNYFILCFRKHFDTTPYRYRKLFQTRKLIADSRKYV